MAVDRSSGDNFRSFVEQSFKNNESLEDSEEIRNPEAHESLLFHPPVPDGTSAKGDHVQAVEKVSDEESNPDPQHGIAKESIFSWLLNKWIVEILACLLAIVALVAIVITLAIHDGRPLPEWPFGISVNALVSVFAVILKGSMMLPVGEGWMSLVNLFDTHL